MKKIFYISVLILLFATACSRKKHSADKTKMEDRIEIIPFYQNQVALKDLHQIDTNLFLVEPEEFLDQEAFSKFTDAIKAMIKDPKSKIFYGGYETKPMTATNMKERFMECDSVVPVDSLDNPIGPHMWVCDSTSRMNEISRIYFYESWYLNTKTNLIEKETLGYAVWQYVADKEAYREMFIVFRDEKSAEKAKKYYFY